MAQPIFDKKDQLERIVKYLIPGEDLYAVFDCKGGGDRFRRHHRPARYLLRSRILFKKKNMVSIPYNQMIGVAFFWSVIHALWLITRI